MNNHESAMADFYDHEQESSPTGRRKAPDWGGDDLFTTTPRRRRFARPLRGDHPTDGFDRGSRRETMEHPVQRAGLASAAETDGVEFVASTVGAVGTLEPPVIDA